MRRAPYDSPPRHLPGAAWWLAAAVLSLTLSLLGAVPQSILSEAIKDAAASITTDDLRAHLSYIASDELQGRGVGHEGNDLAARYLAAAFERIGVKAAGTDGFFQAFDLYTATLGKTNVVTLEPSQPDGSPTRYEPGEDFYPASVSPSGFVSGAAVFAGYGITAPELKYDDYRGIDPSGKLVVVLAHEPEEDEDASRFSGRERTRHAEIATKAATARAHGAIGLLVVPDAAQHPSQKQLRNLKEVWPDQPSVLSRRFALAENFDAAPFPTGMISVRVAETLIQDPVRDGPQTIEAVQHAIDRALDEAGSEGEVSGPASFELANRQVRFEVEIERRTVHTHNVLAMVEGTDPSLREEVVIIGAHFDHDGLDASGRIFNGADDDGSGTAAVLEIAEATIRAVRRGATPRRTLLFALWNAEEKGSLGALHYLRHPLPAAGTVIAMLNMDMVGRSEEVTDPNSPRFRGLQRTTASENRDALHLIGYSYSPDLAAAVKRENSVGLKLRTEYDTNAQNLVRRSDQWPFLERRIPALFFTTGLHSDYHTPDDDVAKIDFRKLARIARLVYQVSWRLAIQDERPRYVDPKAAASSP